MSKPYRIESQKLPGLAKVAEEAGEYLQIFGKIIGADGLTYFDGKDLSSALSDELNDLLAAVQFALECNNLHDASRVASKLTKFRGWRRQMLRHQEKT